MAEMTCFIMDNLLGKDFFDILRIYDLKGSTMGRIVKLSEEEQKTNSGLRVLKDLNFIKNEEKLKITEKRKNALLEVIERDAKFLARNNLMDYSLLFIKAKNPKKAKQRVAIMPALVFVRSKDGSNQLQLRALQEAPFKNLMRQISRMQD